MRTSALSLPLNWLPSGLAVPHFIKHLVDNRDDRLRVYCRVVLTKIGYRAVVLLIEALKAEDPRLVASVAVALADIRDARALPKITIPDRQPRRRHR